MLDSKNPDNLYQSSKSYAIADTNSLLNCDREPIHIPGSIQPHGYLIAFSEEQTVLYLSKNLEELVNKPGHEFLGKPLRELLGKVEAAEISRNAGLIGNKINKKRHFNLHIASHDGVFLPFELTLHWNEELYIMELEPVREKEPVLVDLEFINDSIRQFREAESTKELAKVVARKLKELSLFNRVMIYRFHDDGSGEVIAEEKEEALAPYLGLWYPATDIPQQVRALYQKIPIRLIPDVNHKPVTLFSAEKKQPEKPLDLSFASLRSVSPIHIQYLKNMGVGASMSVSIIQNNKLWGLLAFHHQQPYHLSYHYRQLCLLLSNAFSLVLGEKEEGEIRAYKNRIQEVQALLFQQMSRAEKFTDGLYKQEPNVHNLVNSGGCVLCQGDEIISMGEVPSNDQVRELVGWLQKNVQDNIYFTSKLPDHYAPAKEFRKYGSGILAVAISHVQKEYIIWFRPEVVQTISWAGIKEKGSNEPDSEIELSPRKSFEAWSEQLRNTSEAWLPMEVEAAKALRGFIVDMIFRISGELKLRADILSRINHQLGSDKNELDSFAYIVSHDLKEPLRGIQQYASFVLEDYASVLDSAGQAKLQTLVRLGKRMQQLIDSLLHFSRLGRFELQFERVNLEELIQEVLDIFEPQLLKEGVKVEIEKNLPTVLCDSLRVSEVFTNLVSNALKYNAKDTKEVNIGFRKAGNKEVSPSGYVFYVKDNGIGIESRFYGEIFDIFRRLHGRDVFGGGTGAGLTITKKIVERHGGQIWVESQPGTGSIFYFSL